MGVTILISAQQEEKYLGIQSNSFDEYVTSLVMEKQHDKDLGWEDISNLCYKKYGVIYSRHWYSRRYRDYLLVPTDNIAETDTDELSLKIRELKKARVQLSDERTQNNAYIRKLARDDTIKEIALAAVDKMSGKKLLPTYAKPRTNANSTSEALVLISDWHYGLDFEIPLNTFNNEIAKYRIQSLLDETIEYCVARDISTIHVLNLADLIAGRIHLTIRLESRIDTITQIIEVSEILSEFLNELSQYFEVHYYSCLDNHSRVEPDKAQSLDLESLSRITDWYLQARLKNNVIFHGNEFGEDIITLNVLGHNIAGVHGHLDKPQKVIENISLITRKSYDLICMAHLHHFSMDEKSGCRIVCNGALVGADKFSSNLRLYSKPSQTIIIVSEDRVCEDIHIVEL